MRANQLRLWFASMAYALVCALRRLGLAQARRVCKTEFCRKVERCPSRDDG